jgi:hypothetical protein
MECYSATKNEILSFVGNGMELENIVSKVSQAQKIKLSGSLSYMKYRPNANVAIL